MGQQDLMSPDAERALVGAALLSPEVFAAQNIPPDAFFIGKWRAVWRAGHRLLREGITPDLVTLPDALAREGAAVGLADLTEALKATPSSVYADSYAATVLDYSKRRRLQAAMQIMTAALHGNGRYDAELNDLHDAVQDAMFKAGPVSFRTADQIAEFYGSVTWEWPGWLPIGYLTMIVGPQGQGKSYLAARLVATLTGAIPTWPDGTRREGMPGRVLVVETEELRGVYVERLDLMGVDRAKVFFGPGDETHIPNLVKEAAAVERLAVQEGVSAIVVDSLSGAHTGDEDKGLAMRPVLQRLAAMASRLRLPVILVHHVRKRQTIEPVTVTLDRIRGSSTIPQFCRSVIGLYRLEDGDQVGPVRMEVIKATFTTPPRALGFTITDDGLEFGDAPAEAKPETKVDRAADLLLVLLRRGPMAAGDLQREADEAGVTWSTCKRAKDRLGIITKRDGKAGNWSWALPTRDE